MSVPVLNRGLQPTPSRRTGQDKNPGGYGLPPHHGYGQPYQGIMQDGRPHGYGLPPQQIMQDSQFRSRPSAACIGNQMEGQHHHSSFHQNPASGSIRANIVAEPYVRNDRQYIKEGEGFNQYPQAPTDQMAASKSHVQFSSKFSTPFQQDANAQSVSGKSNIQPTQEQVHQFSTSDHDCKTKQTDSLRRMDSEHFTERRNQFSHYETMQNDTIGNWNRQVNYEMHHGRPDGFHYKSSWQVNPSESQSSRRMEYQSKVENTEYQHQNLNKSVSKSQHYVTSSSNGLPQPIRSSSSNQYARDLNLPLNHQSGSPFPPQFPEVPIMHHHQGPIQRPQSPQLPSPLFIQNQFQNFSGQPLVPQPTVYQHYSGFESQNSEQQEAEKKQPSIMPDFKSRSNYNEPVLQKSERPSMEDHSHTAQEREAQQQVDKWLLEKEITAKQKPDRNLDRSNISIPELKLMLRQYVQLLEQLKQQKLVLAVLSNEDEDIWQSELTKTEMMKKTLNEIQRQLEDRDLLRILKWKLQQVKRKRLCKKRRREREYQTKLAQEERRQVLHQRMDDQIVQREQEKVQQKQDAEMQKDIDTALHEVRQKKKDIGNTQAMLRACRKLRNVRREMSIQKGVPVLAQEDAQFEDRIKKLEDLLSQRSQEYRDEERMLQVMLEGEHEELKAKENERRAKKEAERAKKMLHQTKEFLFGKDEEDVFAMGVVMYKEFFTQSERELQTLIDVRRQWDAHLVPDDDPKGTSIPVPWVVPSEASSDAWAAALQTG